MLVIVCVYGCGCDTLGLFGETSHQRTEYSLFPSALFPLGAHAPSPKQLPLPHHFQLPPLRHSSQHHLPRHVAQLLRLQLVQPAAVSAAGAGELVGGEGGEGLPEGRRNSS